MMPKHKGKNLIIISGPSGSGKTTVANRVLSLNPSSARLITTTTRQPREGEINGIDYWFLSREEFLSRINDDDFIEWVESYGNFYGTSYSRLLPLLEVKLVVLAIVDIRGALSLKKTFPESSSIFIKPGSLGRLEETILDRSFSPEEAKERIKGISEKTEQADKFDYIITNNDGYLDKTVSDVEEIIRKNSL